MKVDTKISLKNGKKYLLLLESDLELDGYFLAVELNEKDEVTNNYAVLQRVEKDGKTFTKKIDDPVILNKLLEDYHIQYDDEFEN